AIQNIFRVGDAFDAAGVVTGPRPAELDCSNHGKEPIQIGQASFTPALPRLPNQDQEVLSLRPVRSEHNFFEDNVMEIILDLIKEGYRLPFEESPTRAHLKNNKSSLLHANFVEESIMELVRGERVLEVDSPPFIVNPLSVSAQSSGTVMLNGFLIAKLRVELFKWGA
ncbi:hypothetical protein AC249_AIPGENE20390, partial [Exaiptasia diaphana]